MPEQVEQASRLVAAASSPILIFRKPSKHHRWGHRRRVGSSPTKPPLDSALAETAAATQAPAAARRGARLFKGPRRKIEVMLVES